MTTPDHRPSRDCSAANRSCPAPHFYRPILVSIGQAGDAPAVTAGRGPSAPAGPGAAQATEKPPAGAGPRRAYLELEPRASAVPRGRRYVRDTLTQWGLSEARDDAELIICELLTNAISASAALPFRASIGLLVAACPGRLIALVWDASPRPPVLSDPDDNALTGRGLAIVDALSTRWGWVPDERGKIVWATLDLGCHCPTAAS